MLLLIAILVTIKGQIASKKSLVVLSPGKGHSKAVFCFYVN